jgi:thioredoxin-related protein
MKQIAIILTFILLSLNGSGDTIDYWHVYINDSLVAKFDENSKDLTFKLDARSIREEDKITIRYFKDTHCIDCTYFLFVRDQQNRKLREANTTEHFGKLTLSLKDIHEFAKVSAYKEFLFDFFERDINGESSAFRHILTLKFS